MYDFSIHSCILTRLILLYLLLNVTFSAKVQLKREVKYGRASLVLYQGKVRHEIQGANCPVGVTFLKPERFSCACVNGVWAFYNVMCDHPFAVIGGHNYCFQMPESYIQQVTVISNPLRPLEDTLAIFDGDQESVHTKVYRNLHLPIEDTDFFLALNSSWTLKSTDGTQELCLNSQYITHVEDPSFLNSMYCNFDDISTLMPSIGAILKGCNESSRKVEPSDCQPLLAPNSEGICMSAPVLEAYDLLEKESKGNLSAGVFKRKWKHTTTVRTTTTTHRTTTSTTKPTTQSTTSEITTTSTTPSPETTEETQKKEGSGPAASGRRMGQIKKKQGRQSLGSNTTVPTDESNNVPIPNGSEEAPVTEAATPAPITPKPPPEETNPNTNASNPITEGGVGNPIEGSEGDGDHSGVGVLSSAEMIQKMNDEWNNKENFLVPPAVESEPEVMNQIWKYEKMNIQNSLGLSVDDTAQPTSQIVSLIQISRDIMAKICPIVSEEYFTLALETFLAVQRKNYHWKEPYIAYNDYLRIYAALSACKDRASAFEFKNTKKCIKANPEKLLLGKDTENSTIVNIKEKIPAGFSSTGYEPIIESVWKTVVSTHSYCFGDFDDYYNDHHKYTVVLLPTFLNDINKLWFDHRNKVISQEYAGVIGDAAAILADIDKCATATRLVSEYPFDLSRPSIDSETETGDGLLGGGGAPSPTNPPIPTNTEPVAPTPAPTNGGEVSDSARKMVGGGGKDKIPSKAKGRSIISKSSVMKAKARVIRSLPDVIEPGENSQSKHIRSQSEFYTGRKPLETQHLGARHNSFPESAFNLQRDKKQDFNSRQTDNAAIRNGIHSSNFGSAIKLQERRHANELEWKTLGLSTIDAGRPRRTAPVSINSDRVKKSSTSVDNHGKIEAWKKNRLTLDGIGYCLKKYDEPRKFLDQNCDL